jgi:hypothetical protein
VTDRRSGDEKGCQLLDYSADANHNRLVSAFKINDGLVISLCGGFAGSDGNLCQYYHIPASHIIGHHDAPGASTEGPGKRFPIATVQHCLDRPD